MNRGVGECSLGRTGGLIPTERVNRRADIAEPLRGHLDGVPDTLAFPLEADDLSIGDRRPMADANAHAIAHRWRGRDQPVGRTHDEPAAEPATQPILQLLAGL